MTNKGLYLVAEDYGVDVAAAKAQVKANHRAAAKAQADREAKKAAQSEAPEGASTPSPAAQATTTRAKGKGKNSPAARAPVTARTTAEEASAQIAAAFAHIEETDQAPAAQGNEGQAVAIAQPGSAPSGSDGGASEAPDQAPTAQGIEAQPVARAPAAPSPSTKASARSKEGAAVTEGLHPQSAWPFPHAAENARYGITTPPAPAPALVAAIEVAEGLRVRVSADVYAANKQAYAGKQGTVAGPLKGFKGTWRVTFDQADVGEAASSATFKATELEVVTA